MQRIVVVGGPGTGKSTVAAAIAQQLNTTHTELDSLWWGPDWMPNGRHQMRNHVGHLSEADRWVIDGNYIDEVADLLWPLADTIVWLDLPRGKSVRRAIMRSVQRRFNRTYLWNGNREPLRVLAPQSILRLTRRWPQYPSRIAAALAEHGVDEGKLVHLSSEAEVDRWLDRACAR